MRRLTVVAVSVLGGVFGSAVVLGQNAPKSLHEVVIAGDVAQVKQYIDKKANLNAPDSQGFTPLKLAVDWYHADVVKLLLEGGANPNVKDASGATPLLAACMTNQRDSVEALLAGKADPSVKNSSGLTALHLATMMGQLEIVEMLIKAGADVNAAAGNGQTPLAIARERNQAEIADLLTKHGGTVPVVQDQYGAYGDYGTASAQAGPVGPTSQLPEGFVIDPNVIRQELQKVAALQAPLKAVDANSESEQRAWIARRTDNRTLLLRAVQKQFDDEMLFVKRIATQEKAVKTTKAVDDLVAARKKRYERIGDELREQRRQAMLESRESMTVAGGRGRGTSRGRSSGMNTGAADPYGTMSQTRTPRRPATEPNEPPIDPDTQAQIDAWLNSQPDDKTALIEKTHELDAIEYAKLHESADEEKAVKTGVSIMALLMLREERIAKIRQKWIEDDERMQRMQDRMGPNGMQGTQPGMQQGPRRGRRGM